jgi:maleamate amidohydrolase
MAEARGTMRSGDTNVYVRQGYGQRLGFGTKPALLIIDFTNGFADEKLLGGGNIGEAIDNTIDLLITARACKIPIAFSKHAYSPNGSDFGLFVQKNQTLRHLTTGNASTEIVEKLAPWPNELVLLKRHPSVFFGTDLIGWLVTRQVDTVIVTGCSTSGCVRASAVDALCLGLRPIVVRDCVGDRASAPHEANLFDLEQKYADVLPREAVIQYLKTLPTPAGASAR